MPGAAAGQPAPDHPPIHPPPAHLQPLRVHGQNIAEVKATTTAMVDAFSGEVVADLTAPQPTQQGVWVGVGGGAGAGPDRGHEVPLRPLLPASG